MYVWFKLIALFQSLPEYSKGKFKEFTNIGINTQINIQTRFDMRFVTFLENANKTAIKDIGVANRLAVQIHPYQYIAGPSVSVILTNPRANSSTAG